MRRILNRRGRLSMLAVAVVLGAGAIQGSSLTTPAQAADCTTSWANPAGGLWHDDGNWTAGVPNFDSVACITLPGTYTVVTNQGGTGQLVLGGASGTQTLAVTAGARDCSSCGTNTDARFSLGNGDSLVGTNGVVELTGLAAPEYPAVAGGVSHFTFNSPLTVLTMQGTFISDPTGLEGGDVAEQRGFGNGGTFVNEGTVEINANTAYFGGAETFSNQSLLEIAGGKTFHTESNGNSFVNDAGGSIVNNGAFVQQGGNGFTEGDGTTSGNPVLVDSSLTFTGNGASTFDMVGGAVSGNMAAGQNLTIEAGTPYGPYAAVGYQAPATVAGTITLTSLGGGGGGTALLDVGPISPDNALTITGSLIVDPSGGGNRQLRGYIVNHGTVAINADTAFFGGGSTIANHGSFAIADGKTFADNATFNNGADGTLATTIDANTNTFGQMNGGGIVNLDGKLKVTTVGSPAVGSTWPIISGVGRSGTFASYDFASTNYDTLYPPDGVTLVVLASVIDPTITAAGTPVNASEGSVFNGTVATLGDPDTAATASEYTATIDWGDGSTSQGNITGGGGTGSFTVSGSHTYTEEGTYTVVTTITDKDNALNTANATGTAKVTDAALTANGTNLNSANPVSGVVATFTDADPNGAVSDYSASIDWGDGSPTSAGTIASSGGGFTVSGTHSYVALGPYTLKIHICDAGGSCADATSHVLVFAYTAGGSFAVGDQTVGPISGAAGKSVYFWGSMWAGKNSLSGGAPPSAFKGFADSLAGPACGVDWITSPGDSGLPPAAVPSYLAVIVSSSVTKVGTSISGNDVHVVIVKTNPGYGPQPGTPGTGTIVGVLC
jgi:hypothetical protein